MIKRMMLGRSNLQDQDSIRWSMLSPCSSCISSTL